MTWWVLHMSQEWGEGQASRGLVAECQTDAAPAMAEASPHPGEEEGLRRPEVEGEEGLSAEQVAKELGDGEQWGLKETHKLGLI